MNNNMNRSCLSVHNLRTLLVVILSVPLLLACGFDTDKSANQLKKAVDPTFTPSDTSQASNVVAYSPSSTPLSTETPPPSPTPTTTPVPPTATPVVYTVQSGDTLASIAERFGVTVEDVLAVNTIDNPDSLSIDAELVIPVNDEDSSESAVAEADTADTSEPADSATETSEGTGGASGEASSGDGVSSENTPIVIEVPDVGDAGEIHYVAEGETLSSIAEQYSVSLDALLMVNGIRSDAQLMAGEPLVIPKGTPTPAPTRTPTPAPIVASPTPTPVSIEALSEPATTTFQAESLSPTPTETPVPPTPTPVVYTVTRGDTPGRIARQFGVTVDELLAANPGMNPTGLQVGDKVTIPTDADTLPTPTPTSTPTPVNMVYTEHEVAEDETTIADIAEVYDMSSAELASANEGVSEEDEVEAGTTLRVPVGTATPTPTATAIPTRTPTPGPKYVAPFPLSPKSKNVVHANRPVLSWASTGILGEDEFYGVRIRFMVGGELVHTERFQTRRTSLRLPADLALPNGRLIQVRWDVLVMHEMENGQETTDEAVSSLSEPAEFFWQR